VDGDRDRDPARATKAVRSRVVAAVDIGSNSIKMSVGRLGAGGALEEIAWGVETVRLGAGVDQTGRLADERMDVAVATLGRFAGEARAHGAERLIGVATEAVRIAANGADFLARAARETGWELRVVSGAEESALTFRGLAATIDVSGRVVVADIGGGSTELILAEEGVVRTAGSLPLGSGRLTDRAVPADPPTEGDMHRMREAATEALASHAADLPTGSEVRLVAVGGTGEYLGRLVGSGHRIDAERIDAVLARLGRVPAAAVAAELGIAEARARVLPAGIAIVRALVGLLRPGRVEVARSGIRTGLLLGAFEEG